jgi:HEPN domain-containing protein
MDKKNELRQWIELADKDLALAEFSSKNMWPVPYEIICFHCQQAVEKYLKWFLVLHDFDPPKIHDLEELGKFCETILPQFSEIYEGCSLLTGYSVHFRYPSEIQIEKEDMDRALKHARSICEFVRTLVPEQFENTDKIEDENEK